MSYVVHQKIRGHIYAYKVTGEWVPSKKNSKQRRKYLGKVDENGNIIPKVHCTMPVRIDGAYDFGDVFLVLGIAGDLRLDTILHEILPDHGRKTLILAANRLIMSGGMKLI